MAAQVTDTQTLQSEALLTQEELSQFQMVWRRFRKHRLALIAPIDENYTKVPGALLPDAVQPDPAFKHLKPMTDGHVLGTDEIGRDILSRLLFGARVSLYVGVMAVLGSETIGAVLGAISGYYGGAIDSILMRVTDFMLTMPLLPILLVLSAMLAQQAPTAFARLNYLIIILRACSWMTAARLGRGGVLSLREQEFTQNSRALGAGDLRIILRHMLPNAMAQ